MLATERITYLLPQRVCLPVEPEKQSIVKRLKARRNGKA